MKTQQKTMWMPFLTFGINLFLFLTINGCGKGEVDSIQQAEYVYVNKSDKALKFELYKSESNGSHEFSLKVKDSITFIVSNFPGAFPFIDTEIQGRTGDSVIIRFEDNKCATYTRNRVSGTFGGNGVFDLSKYENYSQNIVNQKTYRLRYLIDTKDYLMSTDCK